MSIKQYYHHDEDERRHNVERRECHYTYYIPERRNGRDRRRDSTSILHRSLK